MIPTRNYDGAWLVLDKLADQALSARLKLNVKCICILCVRCAIDAHPGRLLSRPDQPSRINSDPSFEWRERVDQGCERPSVVRKAGRRELVGGWHKPFPTTNLTYDKGRYHW